jgi:prepilin-type N-terminal cleavage/methylation domain-containing protein
MKITTMSINNKSRGFTLVEIAIVMLIVTLLLTGLVPTISSQIEQRQTNETRKQLDEIQQALVGFALINGRLPCPASTTSNGVESFVLGGNPTNGNCSNFYDGFVPSATLGLSTTGSTGYAVDAWNNRIHYAVTTAMGNTFTMLDGMRLAGISSLNNADLLVCSSAAAPGFTPLSCGPNNALTSGVPVVIYSTGKNGGYGGTGIDEAANPNPNNITSADRTFVSHTPTPSPNEFDDMVIWISSNVLINRMVAAGKLP